MDSWVFTYRIGELEREMRLHGTIKEALWKYLQLRGDFPGSELLKIERV